MINTQEIRTAVDGVIVGVLKASGAGRSGTGTGTCLAIEPHMELGRDFGLDSLDFVELVSELETKFDIEMSDKIFDAVKTVDDLYLYMSSTLAEKKGS